MPKILAFAGSSRRDSFNKKLVKTAASGARDAGAEVTVIDLSDYPMPLFNQDLESSEGMPERARAFKQLLVAADGFLIASPEYNSAFSPLLKNAIDWASRRENEEEARLLAFRGKAAAIMATAGGPLGGLRGLVFLRMLLANLGVVVLPDQVAVPTALEAFDEHGALVDPVQRQSALDLGAKLVDITARLRR